MKPIKSLLTLGAALVALAVSASATVYTDTNTHNVPVYEGQTVNGQWSYGPIAAGEVVTSVQSWFTFASEDSDKEQAYIEVGTGEGPVDQTSYTAYTNFGNSYTFTFGASSIASLLSDAANGLLSYSVSANNIRNLDNDLTFISAKVNVTTRGVPDGGATLAMLGLAFVGFVGFQRKFRLAR